MLKTLLVIIGRPNIYPENLKAMAIIASPLVVLYGKTTAVVANSANCNKSLLSVMCIDGII